MVKETEFSFIILMSISCNLDNIGIGMAYGARKISIPFSSNLLIAVITTAGTLLSAAFGKSMHVFLKPRTANALGSAILICAGLWVAIYDFMASSGSALRDSPGEAPRARKPDSSFRKLLSILDNPCLADSDLSKHIDLKEGALLGLALTLNNVANGVGAGLIGLNIVWLALFVFIFSIATILLGIMAGDRYGNRLFGRFSGLAAGVILIGLGIFDLFM